MTQNSDSDTAKESKLSSSEFSDTSTFDIGEGLWTILTYYHKGSGLGLIG